MQILFFYQLLYLSLLQQYRPVSADLTKLGLASMFAANDNEKPNNAANNVLLITCECSLFA